MTRQLRRWWPPLLLGLATIGAYGLAYYGIGVLVPAIGEETGWSASILAAGFSLGVVGQGGFALVFGHVLDRHGSRRVFIFALMVGSLLLLGASFVRGPIQFMVVWAMGSAVVGGGLFYNVTMPATARLYPEKRALAFSVLTFVGAFASPIFYPLAAWFVDLWGWRGALQAMVALMVLCVAPAAFLVNAPAGQPSRAASREPLRRLLAQPAIARTLVLFAVAGFANSAVLLHQVGAMQAAGLTLAAASGFAGARGFFQIPGRLLLSPVVARFGISGSIGGCYALAATSTVALVLAFSSDHPELLAAYFTIVGGISLGLLSPLNGLFQADVYGDARLGLFSGATVIVTSLAGATGAFLAGVVIELTGTYWHVLLATAALQAAAVGALLWQRSAPMPVSAPPTPTAEEARTPA